MGEDSSNHPDGQRDLDPDSIPEAYRPFTERYVVDADEEDDIRIELNFSPSRDRPYGIHLHDEDYLMARMPVGEGERLLVRYPEIFRFDDRTDDSVSMVFRAELLPDLLGLLRAKERPRHRPDVPLDEQRFLLEHGRKAYTELKRQRLSKNRDHANDPEPGSNTDQEPGTPEHQDIEVSEGDHDRGEIEDDWSDQP